MVILRTREFPLGVAQVSKPVSPISKSAQPDRAPCGFRNPRYGRLGSLRYFRQQRRSLSNTGVAVPLDLCHFARRNIDFEGAEVSDAGSFSLDGNFVVSGCQQSPKVSLVISGK
jgi:hypothetical protein